VAYITRFQINPEERLLLAKFGEAYAQYVRSVRRWAYSARRRSSIAGSFSGWQSGRCVALFTSLLGGCEPLRAQSLASETFKPDRSDPDGGMVHCGTTVYS